MFAGHQLTTTRPASPGSVPHEPVPPGPPGPARVLVVEDDATIAEVVAEYLRHAGVDVRRVGDGRAALTAAAQFHPHLVVLDIMLPGLSGLEVCRQLRAVRPELAVVMLTALGEEDDRIAGLELGADDYLVKPFSPRELVLRVRSVLRRAAITLAVQGPSQLRDGDLQLDLRARTVRRSGVPLALTVREFDLLAHLIAHPGQVQRREELIRQVWGWEVGDTATVTVHVRRLREKVEADPAEPRRLVTVRGVGYRWDAAR